MSELYEALNEEGRDKLYESCEGVCSIGAGWVITLANELSGLDNDWSDINDFLSHAYTYGGQGDRVGECEVCGWHLVLDGEDCEEGDRELCYDCGQETRELDEAEND